tara:strand:- start:813 stop:977 length:165 start_codon:yes stop_codon:yes gene_type:complete
VKKGIVKTKVTSDFILDLYNKTKQIKSQEKKNEMMRQIKILSQHIGEYIIKPID